MSGQASESAKCPVIVLRCHHIILRHPVLNMLSNTPNIIQFYGWTYDHEYVSIFMEPMKSSLQIIIENTRNDPGNFRTSSLHSTHIEYIIVSVLKGLIACKERGVLHGDLKPANILVNEKNEIKLCDFGESIVSKNSKNLMPKGTILYWPPEKFQASNAIEDRIEKENVWSLGIIFLELMVKENPMLSLSGFVKNIDELFSIMPIILKNIKLLREKLDDIKKQKNLGMITYDFIYRCLCDHVTRYTYEELISSNEVNNMTVNIQKKGKLTRFLEKIFTPKVIYFEIC